MSSSSDRLQRLLGGADLKELRKRLRRRYELGRSSDAVSFAKIAVHERRALEGLLGRRSVNAGSMQVSIAELDRACARSGLAASLQEALEHLDGPIRPRAAQRAAHLACWEAVFAAPGANRLAALVGESRGRGLVKRLAADDPDQGNALLEAAARVISALPAEGVPLSHLAARVLGDAHALDEGRPVSTMVLAVLRATDDEHSRETWARSGVLLGELAWPALVLNLPASRRTITGQLVCIARERGEPIHLSLRGLLRSPPDWDVSGLHIFVCENPTVVAMAAERWGSKCRPLVCTDGMPTAAQQTLLRQLAAAGATLHYHGDFDWPGIAIGNLVMRTFNAQPWRFCSADYRPALRGRQLFGSPVSASWDVNLLSAMKQFGHALDEEAVVDVLLRDLGT